MSDEGMNALPPPTPVPLCLKVMALPMPLPLKDLLSPSVVVNVSCI